MMQQALADFIGNYKERVDQGIEDELGSRSREVEEISPHLVSIIEAMQELSLGGKRLRAMLTILGYELAGQKVDGEVIKAAVAMEIFHLGLMIQDDFMDRDLVRRGVPSMIARYSDPHTGNFISMLAGDYTFGWAIESLSALKLPAQRVNAAMAVWGKYFTRVGYGQTLDGLDIADDDTILKILAIKSGEYSCVLPLLLGATMGGADTELLDRLEKYGMELGWVFQLRDDYLGYEKDMAKKGKKTYATMYGKEQVEKAVEEHMNKARTLVSGVLSLPAQAGLPGDSRKVMEGLIEWMGTRAN